MIDHVSVPVRDLAKSGFLYETLLSPLGLTRLVTRGGTIGFGKRYPEFWLNHRPDMVPTPVDTGSHVCLRAPDYEAVRLFHAGALANGCRDAGAPGPRKVELTTYYGAFVVDPDGNKIEAAAFPKF